MRQIASIVPLLVAGLLFGTGLAGCAQTKPFGHKAPPQQQAATNMQLAIEYMKLNKLVEARKTIELALQEDPASADVQLGAGLVFERLNETAIAEKAYAAAARIGKDDPNIQNAYAGFLCRTGKPAAGEKLFAEVAKNPVYQTPEVALVNAGVCELSTGDMLDAQRYFTRALNLRPNMPEALLQLGNVALDEGDAAAALDYVKRDLAVNPATADVLWLGFRAQRQLGDTTAAAAFARRVQSEFPDSAQAQSMRSGLER